MATDPTDPNAPRVGIDEWVASHEGRRLRRSGPLGVVERQLERVPTPLLYLCFGVAAALLPAFTSNGYVINVGLNTVLYMLLALGLNVTVGYAGLLDLGYVAFYGFAAYGYAMLASPKFGLHWDTLAVIPLVVAATAVLGLLVALPSRRLVGDYLAIVTLFFGELFATVYQNGESMSLLGFSKPHDVTGGPNGIPNIDQFHVLGARIGSLNYTAYFYIALVFFMLLLLGMYLLDRSRTGRAWRSLREDPLAAELMGMPVNRLKLVAFACGAGIAGLAGTIFAAANTAVFASEFDFTSGLLIIVYAMLILGGAGSLGGVILGAIVVNVSLEVLRDPGHATWVFYVLLAATLVAKMRPWRWLAVIVAGTAALGFAVHAIVSSVWPRGVHGQAAVGGVLGSGLSHWVILPSNPMTIGNVAFVFLVLAVLALTLLRGWVQRLAMIPTLYLAAFVWENRLAVEPSVTRLILVGVILIVLMNARPQGLLGTSRVEIV
jgi:ABC-type branched-subunit amino acid transport system permease subunit